MVYKFNIRIVIKVILRKIFKLIILLILYIDLKSLYNCLVILEIIQEKQLIMDIMSLYQSYKQQKIIKVK